MNIAENVSKRFVSMMLLNLGFFAVKLITLNLFKGNVIKLYKEKTMIVV